MTEEQLSGKPHDETVRIIIVGEQGDRWTTNEPAMLSH